MRCGCSTRCRVSSAVSSSSSRAHGAAIGRTLSTETQQPGLVARLRSRARALKRDTLTLYLACRDPRTPWYAKALAGAVVAYALSPIDLIPDFVPVLGYVDDLIIVPLGMSIAIRLVPDAVMADCRVQAHEMTERPVDRRAAFVIVAIWIAAAALVLWLAYEVFF